ncbi:Ribosomal protein l21, partial [Globisporangium splendens]
MFRWGNDWDIRWSSFMCTFKDAPGMITVGLLVVLAAGVVVVVVVVVDVAANEDDSEDDDDAVGFNVDCCVVLPLRWLERRSTSAHAARADADADAVLPAATTGAAATAERDRDAIVHFVVIAARISCFPSPSQPFAAPETEQILCVRVGRRATADTAVIGIITHIHIRITAALFLRLVRRRRRRHVGLHSSAVERVETGGLARVALLQRSISALTGSAETPRAAFFRAALAPSHRRNDAVAAAAFSWGMFRLKGLFSKGGSPLRILKQTLTQPSRDLIPFQPIITLFMRQPATQPHKTQAKREERSRMAMLLRSLRALPRSSGPSNALATRFLSVETSSAAANAASVGSEPRATPKFSVVNHPVTTDAIQPQDYFAVIKLGGTQYKVTQGDVVVAEKIKHAKVGEIMDLDEVLLLGNVNQTFVGLPFVEGAKVRARVEEQTVDEKIDIFKKKRRKNYRRWNGFRRQVTVLRVTDVVPVDEA